MKVVQLLDKRLQNVIIRDFLHRSTDLYEAAGLTLQFHFQETELLGNLLKNAMKCPRNPLVIIIGKTVDHGTAGRS